MRNRSRKTHPIRTRFAIGYLAFIGALAAAMFVPAVPADTAPGDHSAIVVTINGEIDDILAGSIERRLQEARERGVQTIIFRIDSPGGLVGSALDICRMILREADRGVRTVAWVEPEAYSAAALISFACDEIWMSPASTIGDAAPIMVAPGGAPVEIDETLRAKVESPILQMFMTGAERSGIDPLLGRAMVQAGVEVWWIEEVEPPAGQEPQRRFVDGETWAKLTKAAEEDRPWREVRDLLPESWRGDDDEEAGATWRLVELPGGRSQPIDGADTLLTVNENDAVLYGIARGIATSLPDLATKLSVTTPQTLEVSGWEAFARWLNSPWVRGILFLMVIVFGYIEFQSPGLIIPGSIAGVALVIFLAAPYAAGLADIWTFILLGIGIALLAVEIFVIPGFGIAGIAGIILLGVSLIGTFVPPEPDGSWVPSLSTTWDAIQTGIIVMSTSLIASVVGLILLAKYMHQIPGLSQLTLGNPEQINLPPVQDLVDQTAQIGDIGVVVQDLRPGGAARFGNEVVDVTCQGQYVEAGTKVQVIKRVGRDIFVRPVA